MSDNKPQIEHAGGTVAVPADDEQLHPSLHSHTPAPRSPAVRESGGYIAEKMWLVVDFLKSSLGRRASRTTSSTTGSTASPVFVDDRQTVAAPVMSEQATKAPLPNVPAGAEQRDQEHTSPAVGAAAATGKGSHTPIALQAAHAVEKAVQDAADYSGSPAVHAMHEEMEADKARQWADVVHTGDAVR